MNIKLVLPKISNFGLNDIPIFKIPPYGLMSLASLTSEVHEVEIIDENIEKIKFDEAPDLVGISTITPNSPRAYEIADKFMGMGCKVVLGGIHPSLMPQEAIKHGNSVVIGEADGIWNSLINDFEKGSLKKFYQGKPCQNLDNLPLLRKGLIKEDMYVMPHLVQTSRGCPFGCDFCTVTKMFGRKVRHKSVDRVIEEVNGFKDEFFFLDDNIGINPEFAKSLFRKLIPLNIKWSAQASINIASDDELLKLAAESGCLTLLIGFESLSQKSLNEVHKPHSIRYYKTVIKKLHDYNINIIGAFIFGFDSDKKDIFKKTLDFIKESEIGLTQFTVLTPYPSTPLFKKLKMENRILTYDWSKYDCLHVVFKPKGMTTQELQDGLLWSYEEMYKPSVKGLFRTFSDKSSRKYIPVILSRFMHNPVKTSRFLCDLLKVTKKLHNFSKTFK